LARRIAEPKAPYYCVFRLFTPAVNDFDCTCGKRHERSGNMSTSAISAKLVTFIGRGNVLPEAQDVIAGIEVSNGATPALASGSMTRRRKKKPAFFGRQ
jgi:hypothetical protein